MAVLVTRPHPDDEATAAGLRAKGLEVLLAPMLRFEPVAFQRRRRRALRRGHRHQRQCAARHRGRTLPAAGCSSCRCSRSANIPPTPRATPVLATSSPAEGDAAALARSGARQRQGEGAEESQPAALSGRRRSGARSRRRTRRARLHRGHADHLPDDSGVRACRARSATLSPANRIEAVLHYSRRSARAFLEAARAAGVEISALALPQCCISDAVASVVRDAGATPGHGGARRRTKMPCSRRWTVLCGPDRATRNERRIWRHAAADTEEPSRWSMTGPKTPTVAGSGPRQARAADHRPRSHEVSGETRNAGGERRPNPTPSRRRRRRYRADFALAIIARDRRRRSPQPW